MLQPRLADAPVWHQGVEHILEAGPVVGMREMNKLVCYYIVDAVRWGIVRQINILWDRVGDILAMPAGWHTTTKLRLPENITILPLPPRAPELNPVENLWQFMRDNWLSNRVFESYDQIVALCCEAWKRLRDQPWRVMSVGHRDWANA